MIDNFLIVFFQNIAGPVGTAMILILWYIDRTFVRKKDLRFFVTLINNKTDDKK